MQLEKVCMMISPSSKKTVRHATVPRKGKPSHTLLSMMAVVVIFLPGCMKLGSGGATKPPPETTMQKEVAEIVKMYRLCLQKYEDNPGTAKEHCSAYRDAIRDLAPDTQKSLVAELLDRLRSQVQ